MKDGYIEDYVSGVEVKATPEEIQAVQPFEKYWLMIMVILKKQLLLIHNIG